MIKPHNNLWVPPGSASAAVPARTKNRVNLKHRTGSLAVGLVMSLLAEHAFSQATPELSAEQQQRRAQERERVLREQQERVPDVRLLKPVVPETVSLPAAELSCFTIHQLKLHAIGSEEAALASQFAWSLDAASGPARGDSPLGRCLGAEGVGVVIQRVQDAVIARGFVTTRVLAEPQDLTGKYQGGLTLSYDNWWTLNDLFYVSLNHDMGGGEGGGQGTRGTTVHYSLPLGYWTVGATASSNRFFRTVAGANQDVVFRGSSQNAEVKVSRLLYRDASGKTTASLKAFQRQSSNFIDDTEVQVQRRVVGGWEFGIGHKEFIGPATLEGKHY